MRPGRAVLLGAALLVLAGIAAPPGLRALWWWRESNPIRRGAVVAARAGCLACHGPDGTRGLPDPNTRGEVPAWDGGVPMMYVDGPGEVREYVLDGLSRRRAASESAAAERSRAAIRMPAYREVLRPGEVDDLVAYFMAVSRMEPLADSAAARGRDLVGEHRCEACHGIAGAGGVANPGSLTGYVPGWLGDDYGELVESETELREWILDGGIRRFRDDWLARYFVNRQRLRMPAYARAISDADVLAISSYIKLLREKR
ncbi:MAG: c-type cytochrome [Candidatus Polarisedimenticolia bacterium]